MPDALFSSSIKERLRCKEIEREREVMIPLAVAPLPLWKAKNAHTTLKFHKKVLPLVNVTFATQLIDGLIKREIGHLWPHTAAS